tara:strand:- start:148 stop:438 length:291 start_codon:yes stop_codon:yes gene_type:complete
MSGKKPTMNQVKNVINNMLVELSSLRQAVVRLDSILLTYIEFKGDGTKWNEWLDKKIKEEESKENKDEPKSKKSGNSSRTNRNTKARKKAVAKSNQ